MTEEKYWVLRISKKWVSRGVLLSIPLFVLYVLMTRPVVCEPTDRTRSAIMISVASRAKVQIGDFMLANPGKPVQIDAKSLLPEDLGESAEGERGQIAFREITSKGEIRMFSPQIGVMLVLSPTVTGKQIKWKCWGRPEKKVPAFCRS